MPFADCPLPSASPAEVEAAAEGEVDARPDEEVEGLAEGEPEAPADALLDVPAAGSFDDGGTSTESAVAACWSSCSPQAEVTVRVMRTAAVIRTGR
ncbi:hypothetical protein [Streptomyces chartreusis]|uniref:hypothetical protein n=1 Tax=Streptomyces chartreusis TaxID=1969 RepID=UPI0037BC9B26